ncbi:RNA 2',3'-cyclic phosphodiesterase [Candidatus Peregrinibacteria bacterium]|nr:RNA 2',3'-cyclic phosphodiesterase [Candidatus Peregrinibacteria bacterium]
MRLFIAIDLPENVKDYLRKLQAVLPQVKMSKTHDFHLTLKFLGSCEERRCKKIKEELAHIPFQPFESCLENIGTFGGKSPRVVWVGLKVPTWLQETAYEIEDHMEKLGFEKERRFVPHITLARIKFIENPQQFVEDLKKISVDRISFPVSQFHLFESTLHVKLATFSGQGAGEFH